MTDVYIHPTSIVHKGAYLDTGVNIGPFCIVGANTKIGKNTTLQSHCVVTGHTTLGEENQIFPFASVGNTPQDLKYKGEATTLFIGNKNIIRESVTLQPGTIQATATTIIGNENLFMAYSHVAHDCVVGNNNILANSVALSGHVTVGNFVTIGGLAGVHQFVRMGDYSMTAGGAIVVEDLPPFCMSQGDRAALRGLNIVGLKRRGFSEESIFMIKKCYRRIFFGGFATVELALESCHEQKLTNNENVVKFIEFMRSTKRGVMRPPNQLKHDNGSTE
jgi:UDP-N-acetylglucosamine acyltransferase